MKGGGDDLFLQSIGNIYDTNCQGILSGAVGPLALVGSDSSATVRLCWNATKS